ncbi:FAD-binding oxidoreductase [Peribacillus sp. NPDC096622]|uniref:FAD-binding oxidoreductase n=1 Tax=Peribacillus sp. NPDC096622 TaxID=3364396 RepID=UPI003827F0E6
MEQHSHDESYHTPYLPDMVIYPRDTAEVRAIMGYANEHGIPVIPFGLGSRQDASSRQTALVLTQEKEEDDRIISHHCIREIHKERLQ